jgi:L-amino acid N-acyltransferase YncA
MTDENGEPFVEIVPVPQEGRLRLVPILEKSFEGIYLWHAKRTLLNIDVVWLARTREGDDAGLIMLKRLGEGAGYVYYVAVSPRFRMMGIGSRLLDEALAYFARDGVLDVYASIEEENMGSKKLFDSRGFERVLGSQMAERYGRVRSLLMYREMMVVPGKILLGKRL